MKSHECCRKTCEKWRERLKEVDSVLTQALTQVRAERDEALRREADLISEASVLRADVQALRRERDEAITTREELRLRMALDHAGIEQREAQAVEIVDIRARVQLLEKGIRHLLEGVWGSRKQRLAEQFGIDLKE